LQRLFSTFPNSWPGAGLLLQRISLALALIYLDTPDLLSSSGTIRYTQALIGAVVGIILFGGLWTPVVGALVALGEMWFALSHPFPRREELWIHIFLSVMAISVAMLGPGAWSIDARLFGRKRFAIDRTRGRKQSP
jgi:uncharacterized membrane protein YphA (DoxX/SURF4 family)